MLFLLSGASGFIGGYLAQYLGAQGHAVRRLVRAETRMESEFAWNPQRGEINVAAFDGVDVVVNLSGAGIADRRWTPQYKREIRDSRVQSTSLLARSIAELQAPSVFVSMSAIGWYGHRDPGEVQTEESPSGSGFMAEVSQAWEAAAEPARNAGVRVIHPRMGVVVGNGAMLQKLAPLFRSGIGGRLGSGRQVMSWIALDDIGPALLHCNEHGLSGAFNFTSPQPVTNGEFTTELAAQLHRPAITTVPAFALRAMLGEVADELLYGQNVHPRKLEDSGYVFSLPSLHDALVKYLPLI
ncbi:MAG: TIGR01777 family oxidoreductase [bacterium]|nr:TIGR01777 family oxidoreductase [bacterium]